MNRVLCAGGVLLIFCVGLFIKDAGATPALARKYKTTCVTCHAPFPKLSAFGEAVRLNGYKIPENDELYVKQEPLSMGAEAYKKVFPKSIWPSSLPGVPPVSFRILADVNADTTGHIKNSTDFSFPTEIDVHALASFGEHFSTFVEIATAPTGPGSTVSVPAAWLMYQNLFPSVLGTNHLNVKAGNIGKLEITLPNIRFDNSYQANDYLAFDELGLGSQPGFEINGFGRHWRYALGVVKSDTSNDRRDFYGQLSFKFGGLGYDGSGGSMQEGGLTTSPAGYWRDNSICFGLFGYRTYDGNVDTNGIGPIAFDRFGGDIRLNYEDFSIAAGYLRGVHNDLITGPINQFTGSALPLTINEDIFTAEAQYYVFPWLVPYVRYEMVSVTNADSLDKSRIVLGATALAIANVRVNLEGRVYLKNDPTNIPGVVANIENGNLSIDDDRVTLRLDWAF